MERNEEDRVIQWKTKRKKETKAKREIKRVKEEEESDPQTDRDKRRKCGSMRQEVWQKRDKGRERK